MMRIFGITELNMFYIGVELHCLILYRLFNRAKKCNHILKYCAEKTCMNFKAISHTQRTCFCVKQGSGMQNNTKAREMHLKKVNFFELDT